jgi:hypothetical protein
MFMKIFSFILAFVILGFSLLPCGDAKAMTMNVNEPTTQGLNTNTREQHDTEHQDNCPPQCICNCCSVTSFFHYSTITVAATPIENQINHVSRYSGSLISLSLPVWQPPQLI